MNNTIDQLEKTTLQNIELLFRLDDEGDIIATFLYTWEWDHFREKIFDNIKKLDYNYSNFLSNSVNEIIDYLYYAACRRLEDYHFEDTRLIISVTDQETIIDIIKEFVGEYCKNSEFTERQAEIILKKIMGILLDSTERATYYVNIAKKIEKARKIVNDKLTELFDN